MQIQDKPPFDTPFEWIGGEAGGPRARRALLRPDGPRAGLCANCARCTAASLDNARQRLFLFLCGWLGGPQHYTDRFGHPMLRARHLPQSIGGHRIGIRERDEWLACMDQAMGETGVPEDLRERLRGSFFQTADWMRN